MNLRVDEWSYWLASHQINPDRVLVPVRLYPGSDGTVYMEVTILLSTDSDMPLMVEGIPHPITETKVIPVPMLWLTDPDLSMETLTEN